MEISEDAHLAALDHMLAESREIAGSGAPGIDRGGHARAAAEIFGVDPERGPAPVNVGVQVDESRGDDKAGYIADIGCGIGTQRGADARHLALRTRRRSPRRASATDRPRGRRA